MSLENKSYSANLEQKEIEIKYPLAAELKLDQEQFIAATKKEYLEKLDNTNIDVKETLEISTAINKSLKLDVDKLFSIADKTTEQYEDITKDQLSIILLQSIADTNENKLMRKIAKKLIKKVGK